MPFSKPSRQRKQDANAAQKVLDKAMLSVGGDEMYALIFTVKIKAKHIQQFERDFDVFFKYFLKHNKYE